MSCKDPVARRPPLPGTRLHVGDATTNNQTGPPLQWGTNEWGRGFSGCASRRGPRWGAPPVGPHPQPRSPGRRPWWPMGRARAASVAGCLLLAPSDNSIGGSQALWLCLHGEGPRGAADASTWAESGPDRWGGVAEGGAPGVRSVWPSLLRTPPLPPGHPLPPPSRWPPTWPAKSPDGGFPGLLPVVARFRGCGRESAGACVWPGGPTRRGAHRAPAQPDSSSLLFCLAIYGLASRCRPPLDDDSLLTTTVGCHFGCARWSRHPALPVRHPRLWGNGRRGAVGAGHSPDIMAANGWWLVGVP